MVSRRSLKAMNSSSSITGIQALPIQHRHVSMDSIGSDTPLQRQSSSRGVDTENMSSLSPSPFVVRVTAIASLGGILFGYDLGVIAVALPKLTETFELSDQQQETVVSILYLGGGLGAALGGSLCDHFGRRKAILITDIIFLIGALILYLAPSYQVVVFGRVVVGFAVAVSGIADVSYLHEIAPSRWRGSIVSVNEACISLGFLTAFIVGSVLSYEGYRQAWRPMFGISGIVAILQFAGMWFMPESPVWLRENGKHEESELALQRIYSSDSVSIEMEAVSSSRSSPSIQYNSISVDNADVSFEVGTEPEDHIIYSTIGRSEILHRFCNGVRSTTVLMAQFKDFLSTVYTIYRRQSVIALFLAITQQFCGQTNVLSYSLSIFDSLSEASDSRLLGIMQRWSPMFIGLFKFAVTVVVIWKIEIVGRRKLLLRGLAMIAVGLLSLSIVFVGIDTSVNDHNEDSYDPATPRLGLAFTGILLVVCGYSMSFGPLTWLLTSEIFPTDVRGRALGTSTIVTYSCAWITTSTFLTMQRIMGSMTVFLLHFAITLFGMYFSYMAIPDTGEKDAEAIKHEIDEMPWWRSQEAQLGLARTETQISEHI